MIVKYKWHSQWLKISHLADAGTFTITVSLKYINKKKLKNTTEPLLNFPQLLYLFSISRTVSW